MPQVNPTQINLCVDTLNLIYNPRTNSMLYSRALPWKNGMKLPTNACFTVDRNYMYLY
jgi:hypothetical protein